MKTLMCCVKKYDLRKFLHKIILKTLLTEKFYTHPLKIS